MVAAYRKRKVVAGRSGRCSRIGVARSAEDGKVLLGFTCWHKTNRVVIGQEMLIKAVKEILGVVPEKEGFKIRQGVVA